MKTPGIIQTIIFSVLLTLSGFFLYDTIFEALLPRIDGNQFITNSIKGRFWEKFWFAMVLGSYPVLLFIVWVKSKTSNLKSKLFSGGLILAFMIGALLIRNFIIKTDILSNTKAFDSNIMNTFDINDLHYPLYMLFGLIAGSLAAFFILAKGNKYENKTNDGG